MTTQALRGVLVLSLLVASAACAAPRKEIDSAALAERCVALLRSGDTAEAALLFHYPPEYSVAELAADRAAVEQSLEILLRELGAPGELQEVSHYLALQIGVGGGTVPYWGNKANMGRDVSRVFATRFARDGEGVLTLHIFNSPDGPQLQSLEFGLPVARAGAQERIREVARLMMAAQRERARQ